MRVMNSKLVLNIGPKKGNPRNSEGTFIRNKSGEILYAYSRFSGTDWHDDQPCDIALIRSYDEGETWSEPEIIVSAQMFDATNVMSVSSVTQTNGNIAFYYVIKEKGNHDLLGIVNIGISLGRAILLDNGSFKVERCKVNCENGYYVINNDRLIRLKDGRLVFPIARKIRGTEYAINIFVSEDDGDSFTPYSPWIYMPTNLKSKTGLQEPGLIELNDGKIYMWARTDMAYQYECYSNDGLKSFTAPVPSEFTSPLAPMEIERSPENILFAVYNPIPLYNGREEYYSNVTLGGRNPIIVRKSINDGKTWGVCNIIEANENRGFCYPALFFTKDESLLIAYCRGGSDDGCGLNRLGIRKIRLSDIH